MTRATAAALAMGSSVLLAGACTEDPGREGRRVAG